MIQAIKRLHRTLQDTHPPPFGEHPTVERARLYSARFCALARAQRAIDAYQQRLTTAEAPRLHVVA